MMSTPADGRPPPRSGFLGGGVVVVVGLIVLILMGCSASRGGTRRPWLSRRRGQEDRAARAAKNLEEAVEHLPGVVAAEADFTLGMCYRYDGLTVDLTVRSGADPEQVAVTLVAAGRQGPELSASISVIPVVRTLPNTHPAWLTSRAFPSRAAAGSVTVSSEGRPKISDCDTPRVSRPSEEK